MTQTPQRSVWTLAAPEPAGSPCQAETDRWHLVSTDRAEAAFLDANPLAEHGVSLPAHITTPALVIRSGLIEPEASASGETDEADRMDAARRTWSGEGRARFDAAWCDLCAQAEPRGVELWIHPIAGDVLGDIPGIRALAQGTPNAGVFLEPAALITASMVTEAEDHFVRMLDPLLASPSQPVRAVAITNIAGNALERTRVPIDRGDIEPSVLRAFAARFAGLAPLCVLPEDAGVLA